MSGNGENRKALVRNLAQRHPPRNNSLMTVPEDRRRKRSRDPLVALHYQLAQARHEASLDAIVVADDAGLVVAGAGAWAVCEELAAYAPLLAQGVRNEPGLAGSSRIAELSSLGGGALGAKVDVQEVEVDGQTVLLCARAGSAGAALAARSEARASARRDAMQRAAQGIARILKAA